MHEWTGSAALRTHMECVALCMGAYARALDPAQVERWSVCGLLHDFDYEKHPDPAAHPSVGVAHLRALGLDEETLRAILAHAPRTGVPRESSMAKALFAVDELAGFIVACAKVRPAGIADLSPPSVRKKLKDRSFAAAVSREDIAIGIAELGVDETAHIQACIDAIRSDSVRLGL
ncbi:MAG: HDIG domain-containing protein [Phycisphaerae bacterium]|nr:HDIG domain-containing protein [Phycisphaerae bacterium]